MLVVGLFPLFAHTPHTGPIVVPTETLCSCVLMFVYMAERIERVYCALCVYTAVGVLTTHAPMGYMRHTCLHMMECHVCLSL